MVKNEMAEKRRPKDFSCTLGFVGTSPNINKHKPQYLTYAITLKSISTDIMQLCHSTPHNHAITGMQSYYAMLRNHAISSST